MHQIWKLWKSKDVLFSSLKNTEEKLEKLLYYKFSGFKV